MEQPIDKSFWGLVVEPGKQYKQTPKFNFHVSMAVLDLKTVSNDEPVSVCVQVETGEFILANLTKSHPQVSLDLIFSEGEKLKFYTTGKGSVHLTGYSLPEDDLGDIGEEFSDDESMESELEQLAQTKNKRKNTETLNLTGANAKKLKTNENVKAVEVAKQPKVIDVDPKQLVTKKQDKPDHKKQAQQANQQKNKAPMNNSKLATKGLEVDSESDDSLDEDESVDLNQLNAMADDGEENSSIDDLVDEDLESDDDDLESDDEEDLTKMNTLKNKASNKPNVQAKQGGQKKPNEKPQQGGKPNQQGGKPNQQGGKPYQQKQQNGQMNKSPQFNKSNQGTPFNKSNQGTPFNKGPQKHQQTPFQHKNAGNSHKKGSPFQNNKNKSFGSHNKQQNKKVFN